MIGIFILLNLILCIPPEFQELVNRAILNSQQKISREQREETKYPQFYEYEKISFTLTKTLTNSQTFDIKGFAADQKNAAVIKRKGFNIHTPDYAIVDIENKKLFVMKKQIIAEDNIVIYESYESNFMEIFRNFKIHTKTQEEFYVNNSKHKRIPSAYKDVSFNWDDQNNGPYLKLILDGVKAGVGAKASVNADIDVGFRGFWDSYLSIKFELDLQLAAELKVEDNTQQNYDTNLELLTLLSLKIPKLGFSFNFLNFPITLAVYFKVDSDISNIKIQVPVGFDYFKGYHLIAKKSFSISTNSISNPSWDIQITNLPSKNSLTYFKKQIFKSNLAITINLKCYLSAVFELGKVLVRKNSRNIKKFWSSTPNSSLFNIINWINLSSNFN